MSPEQDKAAWIHIISYAKFIKWKGNSLVYTTSSVITYLRCHLYLSMTYPTTRGMQPLSTPFSTSSTWFKAIILTNYPLLRILLIQYLFSTLRVGYRDQLLPYIDDHRWYGLLKWNSLHRVDNKILSLNISRRSCTLSAKVCNQYVRQKILLF